MEIEIGQIHGTMTWDNDIGQQHGTMAPLIEHLGDICNEIEINITIDFDLFVGNDIFIDIEKNIRQPLKKEE